MNHRPPRAKAEYRATHRAIQIWVTPDQLRALKILAIDRDTNVVAIVRGLIEGELESAIEDKRYAHIPL